MLTKDENGGGVRIAPPALAQFDSLPDSAFVRLPTVASLYGVSGRTIWRWSRAGLLPEPKKLGPQVVGWNVGDLRRVRVQAEAA